MAEYGKLLVNVTTDTGQFPIQNAKITLYVRENVENETGNGNAVSEMDNKENESGAINEDDSSEANSSQERDTFTTMDTSSQTDTTISQSDLPDRLKDATYLEDLSTDESGQTQVVELEAPPLQYSEEPEEPRPYKNYIMEVQAEGYETALIVGVELFPDVTAIQNVKLRDRKGAGEEVHLVVIPPHTLYGDYPAKIPESEIKPIDETGEIVLSRVVIPEYIVVHDGVPSDKSAKNYYVKYKDYIKNVVSSEIYSTWPESTIYANTLAIMSFTLNRVYTEWYRNKGYNFTITSSTAYDQKWIYGRTIYSNINYLVDSIFANYVSRPGLKQPLFTSYCDGSKVSCKGLSQWGSKNLGEQNYSALQILRYYYGNDVYINSADSISGVPSSWPGYNLGIGARGDKVRQLQNQLNRIGRNYPAIGQISADGIYGPKTAETIRTFQRVFSLPVTGITDYATWYEVSSVYTAVARLSEP